MAKHQDWRNNIYFILIEPKEPGNIGASARALKNMGFKHLELVNPVVYDTDEARWFARNALDVLRKVRVYPTFDEAIAEKVLVVGTTRRKGKARGFIIPARECAPKIAEIASGNKVAIVFGREDTGLVNKEIQKCGYVVNIPTNEKQPSLNLAQAVLLVAYELSMLPGSDDTEFLIGMKEVLPFLDRVYEIVRNLGYASRGSRDIEESIMNNIRRIIGRAGLTDWELNMLRGLATKVEGLIEKGKEKIAHEKKS